MSREVKRVILNGGCCSKKEIFLELNFSLDINQLSYLVSLGYIENKNYTNTGLFYLGASSFTAIGPFGSNRLRIKCKNSNCLAGLDKLEAIIKEIKDETEAKIPESSKKVS